MFTLTANNHNIYKLWIGTSRLRWRLFMRRLFIVELVNTHVIDPQRSTGKSILVNNSLFLETPDHNETK